MASTIKKAFEEFQSNLELTPPQATRVSERQVKVREAVEADLSVKRSFLAGSYKRHTLIGPLSSADVDIFVVLDDSYYETYKSNQARLLDKVKASLKKKYTEATEISRNGQAITIQFSDFRVDVVPAFDRPGGGIFIPDSVGKRWIATDPLQHLQIWTDENAAHDGNLISFIKMVKAWNRAHSELLNSFHLEALVLQVLAGYEISEWAATSLEFFNKAKAAVIGYVPDPAGYGGDLGSYLTTSAREQVESRMETARSKAESAIELADEGETQAAIGKWRILFGEKFPAAEQEVAKAASSFGVTQGSTVSQPLYSSRANTTDIAPREEFLEDRGVVFEPRYRASLGATVSKPGFMVRSLNAFLSKFSSQLLKRSTLVFEVTTDAPQPYEVYWKVRNYGHEATGLSQLRGEITSSNGHRTKRETTRYLGDHYVECYIVKNGRCVAWHRLVVPIGNHE